MRIWVSDLGLTNARGKHFWHTATESPESGRIYLMGRMSVDEIGVALCGDLTIIRESSYVGWCIKRRKLYDPGSFSGFSLILNSFSI